MMIIVNARIYSVLLDGEGIHINAKILMSVFKRLIHVQVRDKKILNAITNLRIEKVAITSCDNIFELCNIIYV